MDLYSLIIPAYIAYNASNNKLYVTDAENNRVQVLNSDLTNYPTLLGRKAVAKDSLTNHCGIACNSTGKIYVADYKNNRIQVFTAGGDIPIDLREAWFRQR